MLLNCQCKIQYKHELWNVKKYAQKGTDGMSLLKTGLSACIYNDDNFNSILPHAKEIYN